jgi:hypothetical protein
VFRRAAAVVVDLAIVRWTSTTSATVPTVPGATGVAAHAPEALRFTAPLVGGGEVDLAGYAGRPVLLWFWAPY